MTTAQTIYLIIGVILFIVVAMIYRSITDAIKKRIRNFGRGTVDAMAEQAGLSDSERISLRVRMEKMERDMARKNREKQAANKRMRSE